DRGHGDCAGDCAMAFEDLEAELGLLLTRMQNEPTDRHELYLQIKQKLNELRAFGAPLNSSKTSSRRISEMPLNAAGLGRLSAPRRPPRPCRGLRSRFAVICASRG